MVAGNEVDCRLCDWLKVEIKEQAKETGQRLEIDSNLGDMLNKFRIHYVSINWNERADSFSSVS